MWRENGKPKHYEHVVRRFNEGARTVVIAQEVGVTPRQVQRIIQEAVGPRTSHPRKGKSKEYQLEANFRHTIVTLMRQEGRHFSKCEICGGDIPTGEYQIHHTKYDGATYQDLLIVCRLCNVARENCYLD
jgi:hypothetical protein